MLRRLRNRALLLCALAAVGIVTVPAALAGWSSALSAGPLPVSSATIAAPTGASAVESACVKHDATTLEVTVTWTATSSTGATGYAIKRGTAAGGPFTTIGNVSPRTTTSFVDTTGTLAYTTTYYYVVAATVANWTSPDSAAASVTTLNRNCK